MPLASFYLFDMLLQIVPLCHLLINRVSFAGNERDAANRERLESLGVTHVLNVTSHIPLHFEQEGFTYKRLPASDSGSQNLKQYFDDAFHFIGEHLKRGTCISNFSPVKSVRD